ncbi:alpha/beta hydrolase family protein [Haliscomenobacter sp.]|uniref:alpha/beta hydrolase family protein n=1 Tax=Haliscomenobacter sp. TaxID=2717303 RepID=UPI003593F4DF
MLDINLAGVIAYEDRVATQYLASRNDVDSSRIGCIGFSGGGTRSAFLFATCPLVKAAAIVSMMSTYRGMLDAGHNGTWLCFPTGLSRIADYADVAACRAPLPLLVQYNTADALFTKAGMESAHERIQNHYMSVGKAKAYQGQFYQGPHKFDQSMQNAACEWFQNIFSIK